MNTEIWLEELSFGSNFGNLRAIGSNRFWCYFLVHSFKIKKFEFDFIKRFPRYSSWVLVYTTFAHGRTDGVLAKQFCFFILIKNTYLSRIFLILHFLMTKVSIPFFSILAIGMKTLTSGTYHICQEYQIQMVANQSRIFNGFFWARLNVSEKFKKMYFTCNISNRS